MIGDAIDEHGHQDPTPSRARTETGGLFRCCLDVNLPPHPAVGQTIQCRHCETGGLRYVERDDGERVWQAAWITLGHEWRQHHVANSPRAADADVTRGVSP